MLIIGHEDIGFTPHVTVHTAGQIKDTPSGSTLHLPKFDTKLAAYCRKNGIVYSIAASTVTECILANALGAGYVIVPKQSAQAMQALAQEYLFETKILVEITKIEAIEELALQGIDGVIFPQAIG